MQFQNIAGHNFTAEFAFIYGHKIDQHIRICQVMCHPDHNRRGLVNGEMAAEAEFTAMMDLPETAK